MLVHPLGLPLAVHLLCDPCHLPAQTGRPVGRAKQEDQITRIHIAAHGVGAGPESYVQVFRPKSLLLGRQADTGHVHTHPVAFGHVRFQMHLQLLGHLQWLGRQPHAIEVDTVRLHLQVGLHHSPVQFRLQLGGNVHQVVGDIQSRLPFRLSKAGTETHPRIDFLSI